MGARRKNPEQVLHRAVAQFLRHALRPPTIWTTIGHGGGGRVRGALLKAAGVQPGWPDILVIHVEANESGGIARAFPVVVGMELKAEKGSQSGEQKVVGEAFHGVGASYAILRSVDDVEQYLRANLIPLHASVHGLDVRVVR